MKVNGSLDAKLWQNYGRWVQPTLSGVFWSTCNVAESVKKVFPDHEFWPLLFLDGHSLSHVEDEAFYAEIAKKLIADEGFAIAFNERMEAAAEAAEKEHIALLSLNAPVAEYLPELFRTYNEMAGAWWFPIGLSPMLEREVLASGLAENEEDMAHKVKPYHRTTQLEEQTKQVKAFAERARASGLDTTEKIVADAALLASIDAHVAEFDWFGTHHWNGEPYTRAKCVTDILGVLSRGPSEPEDTPVPVPGNERVWKSIAAFMYWRTHAAETTAKAVYRSRGKLTDQASAWGLSYDDLTYLSAHEIETFMKEGFSLPANFAERKTAYGCLIEEKGERVITGKELEDAIHEAVGGPAEQVSEIKGNVASKGPVVRGTARIMISPKDFARFTEGDILVANETTPDFVPFMKIAAAIVTDTGGITSHAAIVSRELRKPCVIGTKIATQVIRDGDTVEVDAETGVVRILKG